MLFWPSYFPYFIDLSYFFLYFVKLATISLSTSFSGFCRCLPLLWLPLGPCCIYKEPPTFLLVSLLIVSLILNELKKEWKPCHRLESELLSFVFSSNKKEELFNSPYGSIMEVVLFCSTTNSSILPIELFTFASSFSHDLLCFPSIELDEIEAPTFNSCNDVDLVAYFLLFY